MSVQLDVPGTLVDVYVCGDWGWERGVMYLHHSCSSSSFILRIYIIPAKRDILYI